MPDTFKFYAVIEKRPGGGWNWIIEKPGGLPDWLRDSIIRTNGHNTFKWWAEHCAKARLREIRTHLDRPKAETIRIHA